VSQVWAGGLRFGRGFFGPFVVLELFVGHILVQKFIDGVDGKATGNLAKRIDLDLKPFQFGMNLGFFFDLAISTVFFGKDN
jgi:hypothetical protein